MFGVKSNFINVEFRSLEEILNDKWISEDAKNKILNKEIQKEDEQKENENENKIYEEYIEEEVEEKNV